MCFIWSCSYFIVHTSYILYSLLYNLFYTTYIDLKCFMFFQFQLHIVATIKTMSFHVYQKLTEVMLSANCLTKHIHISHRLLGNYYIRYIQYWIGISFCHTHTIHIIQYTQNRYSEQCVIARWYVEEYGTRCTTRH